MLWVALHFPRLPLEALSRGYASSEPRAVAEGRTVLVCDARALEAGVRSGMSLADALALAPRLRTLTRNEALEQAALEGIAGWACGFTPNISLEPPADLLAEVQGSLRFFGGPARLVQRIRAGLQEMGFAVGVAAAPTAQAARWLAASEREDLIEEHRALEAAIAALPVAAVCADSDVLALLRSMGIAAVSELLELPRAASIRRFGRRLFDDLERALGRVPEARAFFTPPERFDSKLELWGEVMQADGVLFAARRLLVELEGVLAARRAGVRSIRLVLVHRRRPPSQVEVGLASPGHGAERLAALLRERLSAFALPEPVEAIRLQAGEFVPLDERTGSLFRDRRGEEEGWDRVLERLQARLGRDSVYGLATHADHRPERAWRAVRSSRKRSAPERLFFGPRPVWLIEPPRRLQEIGGRPCKDGALDLLAGPERIESGWWEGGEVIRDYFIARTPAAALLWVYRERGGGWYLHGIFS